MRHDRPPASDSLVAGSGLGVDPLPEADSPAPRKLSPLLYLLIAAAVALILAWGAAEKGPPRWDDSWYLAAAVRLFDRFGDAPGEDEGHSRCDDEVEQGREFSRGGGILAHQMNLNFRAAKAVIRSRSQPWRKRLMLVRP